MKKITLFIIVLLTMLVYNPTELMADSANMVFAPSGNVKIMNSEFVKMKNEQIYITLYENKSQYRVEYTFVNTGDEQTVIMGFPNSKRTFGTPNETVYGINDFSAFEGNTELKVFRKDEENQKNKSTKSLYECFEVHFNKGETKHITNTYTQDNIESSEDGSFKAIYILTTGASWKGKIDTISVFIDLKVPKNQIVNRTSYLHYEYESDGEIIEEVDTKYYSLSISPGNYIIEQGIYKMVFTDIEPDFDIEISRPPLLVRRLSASSELEDKNDRYSVWNIVDERPETAWVEGKNDSGINEFIKMDIAPPFGIMGEGPYEIEKIGIINGYAKNNDIFKQNNRVKKLRLEYGNQVRTYALKDTIVMQYLKFDKPVYMSTIKITILEVYKGSKWDDTCISEIKIVP